MKKEKTKEITSVFCEYKFTEEEKKQIAQDLAEAIIQDQEVTLQKKAAMSDFKGTLDGIASTITTASRKVKDGYEMKNMDCEVVKDFEKKKVFYIRIDNGEVAKVRPINDNDLQMNLAEQKKINEEKKVEEKKEDDK